MFDNIINLNNHLKKNQIHENFALLGGGDSTSISSSTSITKNFENNQKINRSMLVDSITKLVNNVSSNVIQNNSSSAASSAGSSNILSISGVQCDDVTISGISQKASADNTTIVKSSQTNTSKIANEISNTIDKTIQKIGSTDLAQLQADNTNQLNNFMAATPGYDPNAAQKLVGACPDTKYSLISANNKCNVNTSYTLDASVKQALDLDESFKINDDDNISTTIETKLSQANFASCQASAVASNIISINDIMCTAREAIANTQALALAEKDAAISGIPVSTAKRTRFTVTDIQQEAITKLFMSCVFDQQNVSDITNKIINSISKKFNQIYDAVEKKSATQTPEWKAAKMDLVDLLAAAGTEQIIAAAGNLPASTNSQTPMPTPTTNSQTPTTTTNSQTPQPTNSQTPQPTNSQTSQPTNSQTSQPTNSQPTNSQPTNSQQAQPPSLQQAQPDQSQPTQSQSEAEQPVNSWLIYGGIGLAVIILFIIAIFLINRMF